MRTVLDAIAKAKQDAEAEFREFMPGETFPDDYFTSITYDRLLMRLCGADPSTHMGGDRDEAVRILGNQRRFVDKFWKDEDRENPSKHAVIPAAG